jgi:hypothetical protein
MVKKHISNLWKKLGVFGQRLALVVLILGTLSKPTVIVINWIEDIVHMRKNVAELKIEVALLKEQQSNAYDFMEVLIGVLRANMEKVDSLEYYVPLDFGDVNAYIHKANYSADRYVFVNDSLARLYFSSWVDYMSLYSYTDFNGRFYYVLKRD